MPDAFVAMSELQMKALGRGGSRAFVPVPEKGAALRVAERSEFVGPPGTSVFFYIADAQGTGYSDPGSGKLRWNNADQLAATALYVDWLTQDGFDPTQLFLRTEVGSEFVIQDKDLALNWQRWRMRGPAHNNPDWFDVDVELVASSSPTVQFQHNKGIAVLLNVGAPINQRAVVFPDIDPRVAGAGFWKAGVLTRSEG